MVHISGMSTMGIMVEAREMLEAILSTIDEGIHVVNKEGITIFYNHVAAKHDGLKVEEVINRHLIDVFPSLTSENSTLLKVIKTGKPIINQHQQYTNKNGQRIITVNTTLPIFVSSELVGAIEIAKDYSKIKDLSEKLIDLQAKVNTPLREKNDAVNKAKYNFNDIITNNAQVLKVIELAKKTSQTDSPILIQGETGTGKELFVQAIHNNSPRIKEPFIAQNCAALPASLLEGILFGTIKGSFTGAENRPGLFELAHNGTLFLDEINSLPLELQAKLLRVLQDGVIRRIGDSLNRQVNVRIIAATNVDLLQSVEQGKFRSDLYYRINVVHFILPPLKHRKEDIKLLTPFFIRKYNYRFQKLVIGVSSEVEELFASYQWPGNIRELEHTIEYAMNIIDEDTIMLKHLPLHLQTLNIKSKKLDTTSASAYPWSEGKGLKEILETWERKWIDEALRFENGNVKQTAKLLKIPRQTLQYKISKYFNRPSN